MSTHNEADDRLCCQVCGGGQLNRLNGAERLSRVTSDVRPFPPGGSFAVCGTCGTVQTLPTSAWKRDIAEIYAAYTIYHQSGGVEQGVIDRGNGEATRRSTVLARALAAHAGLPATGTVLDVGCGNGAMLSAISAQFPGWSLHGLELDDRHLPVLQAIPGFQTLHLAGIDALDDHSFDAITMLHALEHFERPTEVLKQLRAKLKPGGVLFIEVPDFAANPFDLLVADHCGHFTAETLSTALRLAGYRIRIMARDWVGKELSAVAEAGDSDLVTELQANGAIGMADRHLAWLGEVVASARAAGASRPFGLFGTSLAATWLANEVGDAVDFFVDDDPSRHGTYLGRPVVPPAQVSAGATLFLPFPPVVAQAIAARLASLPIHAVGPPALAPAG